MSHPKELIEKIAAIVAIDYPAEAGYLYIFERMLGGTHMAPDITIERDRKPVCAVEIGYTRPEKLTAYRDEFGIPDVRWYDKSGNLQFQFAANVSAVHRNRFGCVRVYTRRHVNGCGFTSRYQQHCPCLKWVSVTPRGGVETRKAANTPSFTEACEVAQQILHDFETAGIEPIANSITQAIRWYRSDAVRPREERL